MRQKDPEYIEYPRCGQCRFGREQKQGASHDYVDVIISDPSAAAAMTISFCCSYDPVCIRDSSINDDDHRKSLFGCYERDVSLVSKQLCEL